jgi:predicted solute-binding protein
MPKKLRVCAVRYLNTVPLVWGFLHGEQRDVFDLRFTLPSECADALRASDADIGLVPVAALARQHDLVVIPGHAIACRGPVRSILLVSKKPMEEISSFAADEGSRTSTILAQILLARRFGLRPRVRPYPPKLDDMLDLADAALIIGDPALRIDPAQRQWRGQLLHIYDLGEAWVEMTGLPMVFAVWAVKKLVADPGLTEVFDASAEFGQRHIDEIVEGESKQRDLPADLVRRYLTQHIRFELGEEERRSVEVFLRLAYELGLVERPRDLRYLETEPAIAQQD